MIDFTSPSFSVDFFSIEEGSAYGYPNKKVIHIFATLWRDYADIRFTEYTLLVIPVSEFIKGYAEGGENFVYGLMGEVKQYEDKNLAVDWAADTMKDYFGEREPKVLPYAEITVDTPEGNYITEE